MPSPLEVVPSPVSQAERVTSLVLDRLRLETSRAVRMPSSLPLLPTWNPARTSPELRRGLVLSLGLGGWKKPWVAMWRIFGLLVCLMAVSVASVPRRGWVLRRLPSAVASVRVPGLPK